MISNRFPLRSLVLLSVLSILISACETVEGAGRDLQTAGATVTNEAQQAQTP